MRGRLLLPLAGGLVLVLVSCSSASEVGTSESSIAGVAGSTTVPSSTTPGMAATTPSNGEAVFDEIEPVMASFVDRNELNGAGLVIVDREDGIVHETYVGEFGPDRVSFVASSSKMITAGVLLRLADDGLLDLDAPVAAAVEWGAGNPDITPAQLISNSSGLVGLGPNPAYPPYLCQFLATGEIEACAAGVFTTEDDDADVVPPDTEFRYGGAQWQVAGGLAEAVSGKPWAQLVEEIYVEPCGVDSLGYGNHWSSARGFDYPDGLDPADLEPTDNPNMEGGAYITPQDYAELLLMHLRGGVCDGGRVLSEDAVARAHTDRIAEAYGDEAGPGYGFGWWVHGETGVVSDGGAYGSEPWLDLEDGYGAYLVVEATAAFGQQLLRELRDVVDAAMAAR